MSVCIHRPFTTNIGMFTFPYTRSSTKYKRLHTYQATKLLIRSFCPPKHFNALHQHGHNYMNEKSNGRIYEFWSTSNWIVAIVMKKVAPLETD